MNCKIWKHFAVGEKSQEILNRLEKSGKFTQNSGKVGILASFYFSSDFLNEVY